MKKVLVLVLLLLSIVVTAQDSLVIQNKMIAPFYRYYDNGNLQQSGFVSVLNLYNPKNCEYSMISVCDSTWKMYDTKGKLWQVAEYKEGLKTGVWLYYMQDYIGQAVYVDDVKVRYLEMDYSGKLLYLKDF